MHLPQPDQSSTTDSGTMMYQKSMIFSGLLPRSWFRPPHKQNNDCTTQNKMMKLSKWFVNHFFSEESRKNTTPCHHLNGHRITRFRSFRRPMSDWTQVMLKKKPLTREPEAPLEEYMPSTEPPDINQTTTLRAEFAVFSGHKNFNPAKALCGLFTVLQERFIRRFK